MSIIPANPKVIGSRPYTGNSDGQAKGPRAGMNEWIRQAVKYGAGAFWNNGSYGIRDMKGSPGSLSVHSTGRAVDLSFLVQDKHPTANRKGMVAFMDIVTANANALGLECILDYTPAPFGRGWRCDRQAWKKYTTEEIHGAPGGTWCHFEINPAMADNPTAVKQAFQRVFTEIPQ